MAATSVLPSTVRHTAVQATALRCFLPELAPRKTPIRPRFLEPARRDFRTLAPYRTSQDEVATTKETTWIHGEAPAAEPGPQSESPVTDGYDAISDKPWYLQVQDAQFNQLNPIAARQQLPELPEDPPPVLEGLLNHLSTDIGLDYLSLIDLRTVDPPPALGSSLIMIFGTARSEKHLNVSADRFCRWLRTEHKFTPYADGLLGRNEMKLKMRRKLRRSKMLSMVGARDLGAPDDGISTGWVCVNVGTVNETLAADEELGGGAVGFGRLSNGTQVVVQIMTEDKRGELDLEGLWTGVLKGSLRRQGEVGTLRSNTQSDVPATMDATSRKGISASGSPSRIAPNQQQRQQQQVRVLHTSRRCKVADDESTESSNSFKPDARELEPHILYQANEPSYEDALSPAPDSDEYNLTSAPDARQPSSDHIASGVALQTHLQYLERVSDEAAKEVLGDGEHDQTSTSFLRSFFNQMPTFLRTRHWDAILQLHSRGLQVGHPGYTQKGHIDLLESMAASGAVFYSGLLKRSFKAIMQSAHTPGGGASQPFDNFSTSSKSRALRDPFYDPQDPKPFKEGLHALRSSLGFAFDILDLREAQGYHANTETILCELHDAISSPQVSSQVGEDVTEGQIQRLQNDFRQALDVVIPDISERPRKLTVAMLQTYAETRNWQGFWQVWHSLPLAAQRRDEQLYQILFEGQVIQGRMDQTRRVLNEVVESMGMETPAVCIEADGELALAVARTLRTAGYDLQSENGRWAETWEKCQRGIRLLPDHVLRRAAGVQEVEDRKENMSLNSWKAFRFFDVTTVNIQQSEEHSTFSPNEVTARCAGSEQLFLATADGVVRIISRSLTVQRSFKAHDHGSITFLKYVDGRQLLVTVAEDLSSEPTLKVWALDKFDKKTGLPRCLSTHTVQNNRQTFPISAFAALDDLSQLAFGFGNGAVTVVRGDLVHDRGAKQRIVFETREPITGIEFRAGNTTALYIATTSRLLTLVISGRGAGQPARTLDDLGCAVGCMTLDKTTQDIVVARDDAMYYYGLHGRSSAYPCDGQKAALHAFKDYIVFACPASSTSLSRSSAFGPPVPLTNQTASNTQLTILNTDFTLIAHSETMSSQLQAAFSFGGAFYAITTDGSMIRYHEKPLSQRLDILFQRNLYVLAIQIAQRAGMDTQQQNAIFRRYGDYLYSKRDYDTAMQQYLRAIDASEPSQIIRKFLGTQRINNLIDYLEELHEHGKANSDHTILLLNCYAKLHDVTKLENFIKSPGDSHFDVDTAISMCRQGGYFDQAAYLARKHQDHEVVVSVLVEDLKKYAEALAYIWRLEPGAAYQNLMKYATVLLEHCPQEATQLFIDYYTGQFRPKKDAVITTASSKTEENAKEERGFASSAVQSLASILPLPYMSMPARDSAQEEGTKTETRIVEAIANETPPAYDIPKPRTAFSAFVDHPNELIQFLESFQLPNLQQPSTDGSTEDKINQLTLNPQDTSDITTTLFEMYLRQSRTHPSQKQHYEARARSLIQSSNIPTDASSTGTIDPSNVLLLSDLSRFQTGTTLIREQQRHYADIFRSYVSANDIPGALKALKKYGPEDPSLYPTALASFTSSQETLDIVGATEIDNILRVIEQKRLLSPLQVVQTLSANSVATVGMLKRYLQDTVRKEREQIARDKKATETFRKDTDEKRKRLVELREKPVAFKATRCNSCHYAIEAPVVHFFCGHSFHRRCLNIADDDNDEGMGRGREGGFDIEGVGERGGRGESGLDGVECPVCAPGNVTVRQVKRAQEESRGKHEVFRGQLERSEDRFGVVAEWMGRGVMNAPRGEL
ncbi:MAG: hypothetical protein Q9162_001423 [Coniocarpon cinnabarinum]